jgi:hypothetical protein
MAPTTGQAMPNITMKVLPSLKVEKLPKISRINLSNSEIRKTTNNNFNTSLSCDWQFNPSGFFILGIFRDLGKCKKVLIVIRKTAKI